MHTPDRLGVLLVEGKSYPGELYGSGVPSQARLDVEPADRESLAWTQQQLGVKGKTAQDWCGPLYQNANRLAHLTWLQPLGLDGVAIPNAGHVLLRASTRDELVAE